MSKIQVNDFGLYTPSTTVLERYDGFSKDLIATLSNTLIAHRDRVAVEAKNPRFSPEGRRENIKALSATAAQAIQTIGAQRRKTLENDLKAANDAILFPQWQYCAKALKIDEPTWQARAAEIRDRLNDADNPTVAITDALIAAGGLLEGCNIILSIASDPLLPVLPNRPVLEAAIAKAMAAWQRVAYADECVARDTIEEALVWCDQQIQTALQFVVGQRDIGFITPKDGPAHA